MNTPDTALTILHTLELGEHTPFLLSDQSISIADCSDERSHAKQVMYLTSEET